MDDSFLCKVHEDLIGAGDDYAITFCRSVDGSGTPAAEGRATAVPNPCPDQLLHFVYGTVWGHVTSVRNGLDKLDLGPYSATILNALLNKGPYDLQVLVGISNLTLRAAGKIEFALNPYRQRLGIHDIWHFSVGGLEFHLLTDQRPFPASWAPYLANGSDPIIMTAIDARDIRTVPMLRALIDRMSKR